MNYKFKMKDGNSKLILLKFFLIIPLIPALGLGLQMGLNWKGYLMIYLISLLGLLVGTILVQILNFIFKHHR